MAHVFISYAHVDSEFVLLAKLKIENAGFETWVDSDRLRAGEDWRQAIDDAIRAAAALIAIMSPDAFSSKYVTYEWAYALGKGIRVIPVLIRSTELHPRIEALQFLDFRQSAPWDRLLAELAQIETSTAVGMIRLPADAPPALRNAVEALDGLDSKQRRRALESIGSMNTPLAQQTLIEVMSSHPIEDVRHEALFMVAKLPVNDVSLIPVLRDMLKIARLRDPAMQTLYKISRNANPSDVMTVIARLLPTPPEGFFDDIAPSPKRPSSIRLMPPPPQLAPPSTTPQRSRSSVPFDQEVREFNELLKILGPDLLTTIVRTTLNNGESPHRAVAAQALFWGYETIWQKSNALQMLGNLIEDNDEHIRDLVIRGLSSSRGRGYLVRLIGDWLKLQPAHQAQPFPTLGRTLVPEEAERVLRHLRPEVLLRVLIDDFLDTEDRDRFEKTAYAIISFRDKAVTSLSAMFSPFSLINVNVRHARNIARVLGSMGVPSTTDLFIALLSASDRGMQKIAAEALRRINTPDANTALEKWRENSQRGDSDKID